MSIQKIYVMETVYRVSNRTKTSFTQSRDLWRCGDVPTRHFIFDHMHTITWITWKYYCRWLCNQSPLETGIWFSIRFMGFPEAACLLGSCLSHQPLWPRVELNCFNVLAGLPWAIWEYTGFNLTSSKVAFLPACTAICLVTGITCLQLICDC